MKIERMIILWRSEFCFAFIMVFVFFMTPNFVLASSVKVSTSVTSEVKVEINPDVHSEREIPKNYTGLIIDCRGLGLQRAMSPVIVNENGEIIYGHKNLNPDQINEIGMVAYSIDMQETARAGANPLVIKAKALKSFNSNPVLTNEDASRAIIANEVCGFLDSLSVVFLTDSAVEVPTENSVPSNSSAYTSNEVSTEIAAPLNSSSFISAEVPTGIYAPLSSSAFNAAEVSTEISVPLNSSSSFNSAEASNEIPPLEDYTLTSESENVTYTGIIVDCRGFGLKTSASPIIKNESGKIIYGDKDLDFDKINEIGMAEYTTSIKDSMPRVGEHPFIVRAVKLDKFNTSPILSNKDAERVVLANEAHEFFKELKVVFLTDKI